MAGSFDSSKIKEILDNNESFKEKLEALQTLSQEERNFGLYQVIQEEGTDGKIYWTYHTFLSYILKKLNNSDLHPEEKKHAEKLFIYLAEELSKFDVEKAKGGQKLAFIYSYHLIIHYIFKDRDIDVIKRALNNGLNISLGFNVVINEGKKAITYNIVDEIIAERKQENLVIICAIAQSDNCDVKINPETWVKLDKLVKQLPEEEREKLVFYKTLQSKSAEFVYNLLTRAIRTCRIELLEDNLGNDWVNQFSMKEVFDAISFAISNGIKLTPKHSKGNYYSIFTISDSNNEVITKVIEFYNAHINEYESAFYKIDEYFNAKKNLFIKRELSESLRQKLEEVDFSKIDWYSNWILLKLIDVFGVEGFNYFPSKTKVYKEMKGVYLSIIDKFLETNKYYNLKDILPEAVKKYDKEIVKKLLSKNPELIDLTDQDGNTLLILAMKNSNYSVVDLLLNRGANMSIKNQEGKSFIDYFVHCKNSDTRLNSYINDNYKEAVDICDRIIKVKNIVDKKIDDKINKLLDAKKRPANDAEGNKLVTVDEFLDKMRSPEAKEKVTKIVDVYITPVNTRIERFKEKLIDLRRIAISDIRVECKKCDGFKQKYTEKLRKEYNQEVQANQPNLL